GGALGRGYGVGDGGGVGGCGNDGAGGVVGVLSVMVGDDGVREAGGVAATSIGEVMVAVVGVVTPAMAIVPPAPPKLWPCLTIHKPVDNTNTHKAKKSR